MIETRSKVDLIYTKIPIVLLGVGSAFICSSAVLLIFMILKVKNNVNLSFLL
jgi:hypothetical protein